MSDDLIKRQLARLREFDDGVTPTGWAADAIEALIAHDKMAKKAMDEVTARAEAAETAADFFQSEVKLRNRIPATSDRLAELLARAEAAEKALAEVTIERDELMRARKLNRNTIRRLKFYIADLAPAKEAIASLSDAKIMAHPKVQAFVEAASALKTEGPSTIPTA